MTALARYWLPPLLWMAVIWGLSTDVGSGARTARFLIPLLTLLLPWASPDQLQLAHLLLRKLGHLLEYAILAGLWFRALHAGRGLVTPVSARAAFAVSVGWALLDEIHQMTVASRTASWVDVVIDTAGAALGVAALRLLAGRRRG